MAQGSTIVLLSTFLGHIDPTFFVSGVEELPNLRGWSGRVERQQQRDLGGGVQTGARLHHRGQGKFRSAYDTCSVSDPLYLAGLGSGTGSI